MTVSECLGYISHGTCVCSEFRQQGYSTTLTINNGNTHPDFYEATGYDILPNIYNLIQLYGTDKINMEEFHEGFRRGYEEQNGSQFIDDYQYNESWQRICELMQIPY